jgi:hypothetical protein
VLLEKMDIGESFFGKNHGKLAPKIIYVCILKKKHIDFSVITNNPSMVRSNCIFNG